MVAIPDAAEIKRAVSVLCNGFTELRILSGKLVWSGYYKDYELLAIDAIKQNPHSDGIYIILNTIQPDLFARSANRLKNAKNTTQDSDILTRRWLPIDFDPNRPAGISSTDAEHNAAIEAACACRDWLTGYGVSDNSIILADSGNGAHVLVRLPDIPNVSTDGMVKQILQALSDYLTTDKVSVDLKTFNAARIWKLYGTVARKGDSTDDRPHRQSRILSMPDEIKPASLEVLKTLASLAPVPAPVSTATSTSTFNLDDWLATHGIVVTRKDAYQGGTRFILEECPFYPEHTGTSCAIIQWPSGMLTFNCQHNHCTGKTWADVRELKEPGYKNRTLVLRGGGEGNVLSIRDLVTPSSVVSLVTPVTKRDQTGPSVTSMTNVTDVTNVTLGVVKAYFEETDGQWVEYRDLDNDLGIRTPEQRQARRKSISRLKAEGFIQGHDTISTKHRRIKSGLNEMVLDFDKETAPLSISWPFKIEEKVDVYPKNLIVVAGTKDAGKTAFCLNVARLNCDRMKVHYLNSEMGEVELMNRLRKFADYKEWAKKIQWVERGAAFEDIVFPNDLTIVDFLEVTADFYLVGATLGAIYRKLENGIVLVALQKDPVKQYGRGGAFSVEKARLYVTLNHVDGVNTAKIESGKMWHIQGENPQGLFKTYKLAQGCYFVNESSWQKR
jgi:hypothetical protein